MRAVMGALCLLAFTLIPTSMSAAHSQLIETMPANDSVLERPPARVVFVFNETLIDANNTIAIVDSAGNVVHTEEIPPGGNDVSIAWPDFLASGVWQVSYRVVSADGHPVQGAIVFTIDPEQPSREREPSVISATPDDALASPSSVAPRTGATDSARFFPLVLGGAGVALLLLATAIPIGKKRLRR